MARPLLLAALLGTGNAKGCHYTDQCLAGPCGPGGPCVDTPAGLVCAAEECGPRLGAAAPRFHIRGAAGDKGRAASLLHPYSLFFACNFEQRAL